MSEAVKPPEQRPEHPDFWCKRFGEGVTPWDAGKVPDAFAAISRARTLLPRAAIELDDGPMKVMPASSHALANPAFSLKKP